MIGIIRLFLYALNLLICSIIIFPLALIGKLLPFTFIKKLFQPVYDFMPSFWVYFNNHLNSAQIELDLPPDLDKNTFYLVTANHQAWADILVLYGVFHPRIPMLKFFMKQQLKWVPLVGQMTQIYDFPLLYRHTQAELKLHPEWKKRDIETTRKACERFKDQPGSLMIFAEGTRFTPQKRDKQQSPYQYLLKPKAGGLALALQCMDDKIKHLIDVTLVYPNGRLTFWDYCAGNVKKIRVRARLIPLTHDLYGDYENSPEFRRHFQQFLNQIWKEKDEWIKTHLIP